MDAQEIVGRMTPKRIALFQERVDNDGDCWNWRGPTLLTGYGALSIGKTGNTSNVATTHRIAWLLTFGEWPSNHVLHKCGNKLCCNPDHLYVGDDKDNTRDTLESGVQIGRRGEDHPRAKLTEQQVREIRAKYNPYVYTQAKLASEYGVSRSQIRTIVCGLNWVGV